MIVVTSARSGEQIGFIGLGNMGSHMAQNLLKAGYQLTVYDVSKDSVDNLVSAGNKTNISPAYLKPWFSLLH